MNASTSPLVSIMVPTYRGAAFIAETIASVLRQSLSDFELWIVDDASPDRTPDIVGAITDPRVHYLRNASNLGPTKNWNRCLALARGKYYKLLPHDDLLAPDCLSEQVRVLETDHAQRIALVFGTRDVIGPDGRRLFGRRSIDRGATRIEARALVRRCVRAGSNLIGEPGNGLIRRELVDLVGEYDASHPYLIDLDYWFRVLAHGDAFDTAMPSSSFRLSTNAWSVRLGMRQYADFDGFLRKYSANRWYGIKQTDCAIGRIRARINTIGRAIFYSRLRTKRPANDDADGPSTQFGDPA